MKTSETYVLLLKENGKPKGYAAYSEILSIKIAQNGIFVVFKNGKCAIGFNSEENLIRQIGTRKLKKILLK